MKFEIVLDRDPETGDWAAWCPALPGCASAGMTQEEAVENMREAIVLFLEPDDPQSSAIGSGRPPLPLVDSPNAVTCEVVI